MRKVCSKKKKKKRKEKRKKTPKRYGSMTGYSGAQL